MCGGTLQLCLYVQQLTTQHVHWHIQMAAVCREAYCVGMLGVGINIGVFLYLAFW